MHKDGYNVNVYCHYFSVKVVSFAQVKEAAMTKDTLISTYGKHTAEDMFQQLSAHISANFKTIAVKDDSFHLIGVLNEIREGLILPQGCKFRLQGYDLFLDTPLPFFIKFGCGQLWIGARTIALRFKEEVVRAFRFIITSLLYPALEEFRTITYEANLKYLKAEKLRSILEVNAEPMIKAALRGTGMKFEITFHPLNARLKFWKRKRDVVHVAVLHYDSFEEDLQKTISYYVH